MIPTIPPPVPRVSTAKPSLATAITSALSVSVAAVAATLAVGLAVGLPIALQRFRAVGGGAGHEADPAPVVRLRYADRDDAALGMVNIDADKGVFNAIEQTADNGFILVGGAQRAGRTDFDIMVVKAKAANADDPAREGAVEWVKYNDASRGEYDAASAVQQTDDDGDGQRDDGFIVAGTSSDQGRTDMFLLKLNSQGEPDPAWGAKNPVRYSGTGASSRDETYDVEAVLGADGQPDGYVVVGKSSYFNGAVFVSDVGVVRTDRLGQPDLRWHDAQVPYRPLTFGAATAFEVGYAILQTPSGFLAVGSSGGTEGVDAHPLILEIGTDGKQRRLMVLNELGVAQSFIPTYDRAGGGQQLTGYLVTGYRNGEAPRYQDAMLIKLTTAGMVDTAWGDRPRTYGGEGNDLANSVQQLFDPATGLAAGFLLAGGSNSQDPNFQTDGQLDAYAVRTDQAGDQQQQYLPHTEGTDSIQAIRTIKNSPNLYAAVGSVELVSQNPNVETRAVPELIFFPGDSGPTPGAVFRRGDSDGNGKIDLSDTIFTLNALFKGGPQPKCQDASDADDNGNINLSDAVFTLNYLFKGSGLPPPAPGPEAVGVDPTADDLEACTYATP